MSCTGPMAILLPFDRRIPLARISAYRICGIGWLGGHRGRWIVPPCLGTCGGGGPRLLPCALGKLAGRLLELVHSPPGRRNDRGADQHHAGEPQQTAKPDEHPSSCDQSPVELDVPVGCRIAHNASLVVIRGRLAAVTSDAFVSFQPSGSDRRGERLIV